MVGPDVLSRDSLPLSGKNVLVTGVSRRAGIGYAIACRAAAYGANVFCHHYVPHDDDQEWGRDDLDAVLAGVREHVMPGAQLADKHADLTVPDAAGELVAAVISEFGSLDGLVCNQALTGADGELDELTAEDLDRHWAVDARASILLTQAFARHHEHGTRGSIVFLSSGQELGPMPGMPYAAAKAAIAGATLTISEQLADRGIRVNAVNPGPVDTGYLTEDMWETVSPMFPFGRYGQPDDPARLITWLLTEEAEWMTGQVLNTEGGFGRWRPRGP